MHVLIFFSTNEFFFFHIRDSILISLTIINIADCVLSKYTIVYSRAAIIDHMLTYDKIKHDGSPKQVTTPTIIYHVNFPALQSTFQLFGFQFFSINFLLLFFRYLLFTLWLRISECTIKSIVDGCFFYFGTQRDVAYTHL